jgi:hypothetical protein
MALTERQQEIVDLQKQGKKPSEIAEKLGISTNAVYQQIRRMRGGKGGAKSGRQSARKAPATPTTAPTPAPAPAAAPDLSDLDPAKVLKARRQAIEAEIKANEAERTAIDKEQERVHKRTGDTIAKLKDELTRVEQTEGVLSGSLVAHAKPKPKAPAAKKSGGQSNGKAPTSSGTQGTAAVTGTSGTDANDGSGSGTQPAAPAKAPAAA